MDNASHVKKIIRRALEGRMTGQDSVRLKTAQLIYEEAELLELEMEVLLEMDKESVRLRRLPLDVGTMIRKEKLARKRRRLANSGRVLVGLASVGLFVVGIVSLNKWWEVQMARTGYQALVLPDDRFPASEFACTVHWGDSETIQVTGESRGRLGRLGAMELWRHANGQLQLVQLPVQEDVAAQLWQTLRVTTGAQQQCEVRLPDGGLVRLDAGSTLSFPKEDRFSPNTIIGLVGQALVNVSPEKGKRPQTLVLQTANGSMATRKGEFTVLANRTDTEVVLLDGTVEGEFPIEDGHRSLTSQGDRVTYDRCCTDEDGTVNMVLSEVEQVNLQRAVEWTRRTRHYAGVPLRTFVSEVNRTYNLGVMSVNCIPEYLEITATIHFDDPVSVIYEHIRQAGQAFYEGNGMISFCGPEVDNPRPSSPSGNQPVKDRFELLQDRGLLAYQHIGHPVLRRSSSQAAGVFVLLH